MAMPLNFIQSNPQSIDMGLLTLQDFAGGMVTSQPENSLNETQFSRILNMYIKETGQLKARDPRRPWLKGTESTGWSDASLPELFWHDGLASFAQYTTTGYEAHYYKTSTDAWTILTGNPATRYSAETVKFSVGNATDYLVYDANTSGAVPYRIDKVGAMSALGLTAPTAVGALTQAAVSTGEDGGIDEDGYYGYKITYEYDGGTTNTQYGESAPYDAGTIQVTAVTTAIDAKVTIPLSSATGVFKPGSTVRRVNVYRTHADRLEGPWKYVGGVNKPSGGWNAGGTATDNFVDTVHVGEEGRELPADSASVVNIKHPFVADGRVWGFDRAIPSKLVYTSQGAPDLFPALNYFYLQDAGTGIALFNRNLYVFTEKGCYVLPNADPTTATDLLKVSDKGCVSHRSISDVGIGLCWLGPDNVYFANFNNQAEDGDFAIPIGKPIENQFQGIPSTRRVYAVGTCWRERYYISFTDTNSSSLSYNTKTFVWDTRTGQRNISQGKHGAWTEVDWAADAFVVKGDYLYALDIKNKQIYEQGYAVSSSARDYASNADNTGTPITAIIRTGLVQLSSPISHKKPHAILAIGQSSGCTLTIDFEMNYGSFKTTASATLGSDTIEGNTDDGIWDQCLWGYPLIVSKGVGTKITFGSAHNLPDSGSVVFTGVTGDNATDWNNVAGVSYTKYSNTEIVVVSPTYSAGTTLVGATIPGPISISGAAACTQVNFTASSQSLPASGTIVFTGVTGTSATDWNATAGVSFKKFDTDSISIVTPVYAADTSFAAATAEPPASTEGYDTANWADNTVAGYYVKKRCSPNTKGSVMQINIGTNDVADTQIDKIMVYVRELPYTI